jgi:hypothetical protein
LKEADVEDHLIRRVRDFGGKTAKMTVAGQRGWPDRLVLMPGGITRLVELKRPKGGVLSEGQRRLFGEIANLGLRVYRLNTKDDVDRFLDECEALRRHKQRMRDEANARETNPHNA